MSIIIKCLLFGPEAVVPPTA